MKSKIFILMFCMILLVGTVSAVDWTSIDNFYSFEKGDLKYGKVEIWDKGFFLIGKDTKLAEATLEENTDNCLINCNARIPITMLEEGELIEEIRFLDRKGNLIDIEYSLNILTTEDYQEQTQEKDKLICENKINKNGTSSQECYQTYIYSNITKQREKKISFDVGYIVDPSTYNIEIEGNKPIGIDVDWQIKIKGKWIDVFAWWDSNWDMRREVNITGGETTLNNFTILLNVSHDTDMQSDFDDLRFIDGACSGAQINELSYEIDYKIDSNYSLTWVKIPSLVTGNNNICMYYNNIGANSTSDSINSWDDDYVSVWHFNDEVDSKQNHNLTNANGVTFTEGIIGNTSTFSSASSQSFSTAGSPDWDIGEKTFEVWGNSTASTGATILGYFDDGSNRYAWYIESSSLKFVNIPPTVNPVTPAVLGTNTWQYWTFTRNDTEFAVNINNSNRGTAASGDTLNFTTFYVGQTGFGGFFNGNLDELRVSNISRSSAWLNRSQDNTDFSFFSFGEEELSVGLTITLNTPVDGFSNRSNLVDFNCSSTDDLGVVNLTLIINDVDNQTIFNISSGQNLSLQSIVNVEDGSHNWTCRGADADNNVDTAGVRTFSLDGTLPNISIISPTGDQGTFVSGINLSLEWTALDDNIQTCFYDYGGGNTTIPCSQNQTNFTVTDSTLTSLKFYANDSFGNVNNATTTWSYSFVEINTTFNVNVSETSSQEFSLNITTILDVLSISAFLNYAGQDIPSTTSCTGSNCTISNNFDIPLITSHPSSINAFFWNITIFNGTESTNVVTSSRDQQVSDIILASCNASVTNKTLNFTAFDEQTGLRVDPFRFDASLEMWNGGGSVKQNFSIANASLSEMNLCLAPSDEYFLDGQIEYNEPANISYNSRNYYFQNNTIDNTTLQHIPLYLLNTSSSTTFILRVQDDNLLQLPNHLVLIQRFDVGTNTFNTVQISKTDDNGQTLGFFETEVVDYRFIISFNNQILLVTSPQKIFGESVPFTLTFTIGEDLGAPWATLENVTDVDFTLDYDKTSRIVTYTYVDISGNLTLGRLIVEKQNFSLSTNNLICDINSTLSSATLLCDVGLETDNESGTYIARGIIERGSESFLLKQLSFLIESFSEVAGLLGVILGWFIILIAAFAFKFNEIAGIFMINAAIIFVNLIGLVSFGLVATSAIVAVSIMIVVVLER